MSFTQRLHNAFDAFIKTNNNGTLSGRGLARDFLVNGGRVMKDNTSVIRLSDSDMYRGYPYAAITLRAKTVARIGDEVLFTDYKEGSVRKGESTEHPYLVALRNSLNFDIDRFWFNNSRYIDMKGVRHIAMVRGKEGDTVGEPMEVFALNPYRVIEVVNQADSEIGGYIETRPNGTQRIWEPYQIIRVVDDHPITEDPFGMIEAAKDAQFTLKQAGDFTRSSLNANENAPGIISTKIVLTPEQFQNFKEGIKNSDKGQPIITNGGQVDWQSMNIDLDKSALDKINTIQKLELFAVTGQSGTTMGEETSVNRSTAEVQDDKLVRDQAIPTIKLFASALNLDYRKNYPKDYERYGWKIRVEDPTAKNLEADQKAIAIRDEEFNLTDKLVGAGYDYDSASRYARGEIDLEQLGEPKNERRAAPVASQAETQSFNIAPVINVPETKAPNVTVNSPDIHVVNNQAEPTVINNIDDEHRMGIDVSKIKASEFPEIYEELGIDLDDLGYVMLDVEPFKVTEFVEDGEDDLYVKETEDGEVSYVRGAVAEDTAHVTLMFGLMENSNEWKGAIDKALDGWNINSVIVDSVLYFPTKEEYVPIVAKLKMTQQLAEGNARLKLLPHVQTFPDYNPHITLAYVKNDVNVISKWVSALNGKFKAKSFDIKSGINYGDAKNSHDHNHDATDEDMAFIYNQLEIADNNIIEQSQGSLVNGIVNIDSRLVSYATNSVQNQAFENEEDVVTEQQKEEARRELEFLLLGFYTILFGLYGRSFMQKRASDIGQLVEFKMSRTVTDWIKFSATEASASHIDTVTKEIHKAIQDAYNEATDIAYKALIDSGETASKALYEQARRQALEGAGRQQIISSLKAAQSGISTKRATTIARNETRRAFTQTQFQADTQFLNENGFMERAEKRWKTNSGNPCALCLEQEARGWIPFQENFVNKGETLEYEYEKKNGEKSIRSVVMDYENIDAGVLHVNCQCNYELRVRSEDE